DPVLGVPTSMTAQRLELGEEDEGGPAAPILYQHDAFTREPGTGRLTGITTTGAGSLSEVQCFDYDGYNRLVSAWTLDPLDACGELPDPDPAPEEDEWDVGAASYRAEWLYSESGKVSWRKTQEHGEVALTTHTY